MDSVLIPILIVIFLFAFVKAFQYENRKARNISRDQSISKIDKIDPFISKIDKKLEQLEAENHEWNKRHQYYQELIFRAKSFEKNKKYFEAIALYEEALNFAKNDPYFIIHNYAHCIDRLAINYRKTKQKEKEIELLTKALEDNKDWNSSTYDKWNERLAKLL